MNHRSEVLQLTSNATLESYAAKLVESEERFSLAMRGANDGLWDWDLETDDVYYSPRWKSMLGYQEHELRHTLSSWESLVHPDDKEPVFTKIQNYISGRADSFEVEMRMAHKDGYPVVVLSRAFLVTSESGNQAVRLVGTHVDITERKRSEEFADRNAKILEMIAIGRAASEVYDEIAVMYEERHPGLRCSMLELHGEKLLHGGAPSLPAEYCKAVHGLVFGPDVGSCGTSTFTGERVIVEDIKTDPKWKDIKYFALPHGMRCCWSEPIKSSTGKVLGAFGMYYNHTAVPTEAESKDLSSAARLASIVMERDQAQKQIRTLAYSDELTELPSRGCFYQILEKKISIASRYHQRFGLLYIDLDNFKSTNDSLGHSAGDLLLKEIANRLQTACREVDFVARLGGDEFCIIVEQKDDCPSKEIAEICLQKVSQPLALLTRSIIPTCTIGVSHYLDDGNDLASLIKAADTSLYPAKESGRNQYAFYKPELTREAEYRFQMEQSLREAIEKKHLTLVYQPQVDVITGKVFKVEALSRWHHLELGQVSPVDFIATAERIGMIKTLTEWVLSTACKQTVEWKNRGFDDLCIAVNISPSHFLDEAFVPLVEHTIKETGIQPTDLILEVTESVVQTDPRNLAVFKGLKDLGIQLAIDDFGTGYSSFASLKHLTVDSLKIDKFFVDDMIVDTKALVLVNSMIEMGHELGYKITAEGVETPEQFELLKRMGCECAQGYLFSRPVEASELVDVLRSNLI